MGIFKDKSRGTWQYSFKHLGQRYQKRGFPTKRECEIARAEHRKEAEKRPLQAVESENGFHKVSYEYLDDAIRRFAQKTFEVKRLCYQLFYESLKGDMPINEITIQHLDKYLKTRKTNNNFNIHRKELHCLFEFAKKRKYITENPVDDIGKLPHTPGRKTIPTEQQILQLIAACEPEIERPLFLTILHTLGRVDEVLRLTWDDINFEKRTLSLWTRKRKGGAYEADQLPINDDLHSVLLPLFQKRTQLHAKIKAQTGIDPETQYVFINPRTGSRFLRRPKMMKSLCRRAFDPACKNIEKYAGPVFGFHALRHFMASYLADKGKWSTKTLQRLLRHKSQSTTEIYLHALGDGLREAMSSVEGKFAVAPSGSTFDQKRAEKG